MNILYISSTHSGMHENSIYYDLMQTFREKGHDVTIAYAREKRLNLKTELYHQNNIRYLGVKTGNVSKNKNLIEKGISLLTIDPLFERAFKTYFSNETFDLVLVSTPPITFIRTLRFFKRKSRLTPIYLMLKDIFPQNAVDINMMKEKGFIHTFFKQKERKLYNLVDYIGVMSPANLNYFIIHNPTHASKVEVLPNAIKVRDVRPKHTRQDFNIADDKVVFVYGGNLGYPQAIEYLLDCARSIEVFEDVEFVVAGSGSKQHLIESYIINELPKNFKYLGQLDKDYYDELVYHCDVGLIFLDARFSIPNYPQRVLSYMNASLPILAMTDENTDVGTIAQEHGYGYYINSTDVLGFKEKVQLLANDKVLRKDMGQKAYDYLCDNYTVDHAYEIIINKVKEK